LLVFSIPEYQQFGCTAMALDQEKATPISTLEVPCPSILAVIVLYRMDPSEAPAVRSLLASASTLVHGNPRLKVLLYDNAPSTNPQFPHSDFVDYYAAPCNGGLADAYNYALRIAETEGYEWLFTLDQDSCIPGSILHRMADLTRALQKKEQVVGIVPQLWEGAKSISPSYVGLWRPKSVAKGFSGIPDREITALNSATTWRVSYLREIGGFDLRFWLDYLDHALHRCAFRAGKRVYIAGDIVVQHELSTLDLGGRMSSARFDNLLSAESAFADLYKTPLERAMLLLRWGRECCRYIQRRDNSRFVRATLQAMLRRIFRTRSYRLAQWNRSVDQRQSAVSQGQQELDTIRSCQNSQHTAVEMKSLNP
jgi:GT2 family glycosyltransferase